MIIDHIRDEVEFITLYYSRPMPCQYPLKWLMENPNLFCFYKGKKLVGFITVQKEEFEELGGKEVLTLSGTSVRKNYANNINAIITICNAFKEDMYAFTIKKEAALVLKKAGFKKIQENIYKRVYNG